MALLIDGINLQISGKSVQSFKTSYQTTVYIVIKEQYTFVLGMTLNCIRWEGSSSGDQEF